MFSHQECDDCVLGENSRIKNSWSAVIQVLYLALNLREFAHVCSQIHFSLRQSMEALEEFTTTPAVRIKAHAP